MKRNEKFISIPKFLTEPAPRSSDIKLAGGWSGQVALFKASGIDKIEPYTGRLIEMRDSVIIELELYLKKSSPKAQADKDNCQQLGEILTTVHALIKRGELQENGGILGLTNITKLTTLYQRFEKSVEFPFGRIIIAPLVNDLLKRDEELCSFTDLNNSRTRKTQS